jgi:glycosyltransferase involved in cell wall biosynthesis
MKILQTPPRIWTTGGVETYVRQLSDELARNGSTITIVCADTGHPVPTPAGVRVVPLRPMAWIGNTPITPALPVRLLLEDADLIHTHLPTPWSADWSGIVAAHREIPLVLTYHSGISGKGVAGMVSRLYNRTALRSLFNRADSVILARRTFMPKWMRPWQEKVAVIPIGVDTDEFHPIAQERPIDVFFLSVLDRFHHFKGLDTLLEAIRQVSIDFPEIRVVIGGGGSERASYEARVRSLGIGHQVSFAGYIPPDELNKWYSRSRVFVLPSTDPALETFGIVLLEAMAAGRPVITTEIAGMAEDIRSYDTGFVIPTCEPIALAGAIRNVLMDPEQAELMGARGRRLMEDRYRWPHIAGRIREVYKKLAVEKY